MCVVVVGARRLEPSALTKWLFGCAAGGGGAGGGVWSDVSRCLEDITKRSVGLLQVPNHSHTHTHTHTQAAGF